MGRGRGKESRPPKTPMVTAFGERLKREFKELEMARVVGLLMRPPKTATVTVARAEYQRLRCREVFWRMTARKYAATLKNRPTASICVFCELRAPDDKRCPMNKIPRQYDIVVWVDECDQWRPRKE